MRYLNSLEKFFAFSGGTLLGTRKVKVSHSRILHENGRAAIRYLEGSHEPDFISSHTRAYCEISIGISGIVMLRLAVCREQRLRCKIDDVRETPVGT